MSKRSVLVIDDDRLLCELVGATLELEGIEVREAHHVLEAEQALLEKLPDAVILDVGLPGVDGMFYLQRLRESPRTQGLPIVVISGSEAAASGAVAGGASAFIRKPFDPFHLLGILERAMGETPLAHAFRPGLSVSEAGEQSAELRRLVEFAHRRHEYLEQGYRQTVTALAAALETRYLGSTAHTQRVTAYAMRLAVEVAPALTDDPSLEWGFLLHDVGKIAIADEILLKPGPLDAYERMKMEQHPIIGEQVLASVPLLAGEGLRVVRSHHERWDGKGYPDRLEGEAIPLGARIFAVADALDAMTDDRPHRPRIGWEPALAELRRHQGRQFDPDVIDSLVACETDLKSIRRFRRGREKTKRSSARAKRSSRNFGAA